MRSLKFGLCLGAAVLGLLPNAWGVTNWVSGVGDDTTGTGTEALPYRSITKALATPSINAIVVGAGTYATNWGETFPLNIPDGVSLLGTNGGLAVIDANDQASALSLGSGPSTNLISNLVLIRCQPPAITAGAWQGTIRDCTITDVATGGVATGTAAINYTNGGTSRVVTLTGLYVTNISCNVRHILNIRGVGTLAISNCVFRDITTTIAMASGDGTFIFANNVSIANSGFSTTLQDCLFDNLSAPGIAGFNETGMLLSGQPLFIMDRCVVRNITITAGGQNFYAPNRIASGSAQVRNCLFANVTCGTTYAAIGGFRTPVDVRNCTFDNVDSVFRPTPDTVSYTMTVRNTIVRNCGTLNRNYIDRLFLLSVDLRNTALGNGYSVANSANVVDLDPWFVDAAGSNFHLRALSPLVDLGNNTYTSGPPVDLDSSTRVRDGNADGVATVDLGSYEVNFLNPTAPRFLTSKPTYHFFAGQTPSVPVWIQPPAGGSVTGHVAYGQDLSGAAEVAFATGGETNNLAITIAGSLTVSNGTLVAVRLTETNGTQGVAAGDIGLYLHNALVTITNYASRFYMHQGQTNTYTVQLDDLALSAPGAITITTGSPGGAGNNQITWQGGNTITNGGAVSAGYLQVIAGTGENTVQLSADNGFTFKESGTSNLTITVLGFASPVYVAPTGSDSTGLGTVGSPLRTVGFSTSILRTGEVAILAAGTYSTNTGEVFPISIAEGINVRGVLGPNATGTDSSVIDAASSGFALLLGTLGADPGNQGAATFSGLVIANAKGTAIRGRAWGGVFSNCVMRTVVAGTAQDDTALMRLESLATTRSITLDRVTVTNITANNARLIYVTTAGSVGSATMRNCVFRNISLTAAAGAGSAVFYFNPYSLTMTDCDVDGITAVGLDQNESGILQPISGSMTVDRCKFRNITITSSHQQIIAPNRSTTAKVLNSLFYNIVTGVGGGTTRPVLGGFRSSPIMKNCTLASVSCAFRPTGDFITNTMYVYNTSVSDCSSLNAEPSVSRYLVLTNVNLYNTPLGFGYVAASTNVTTADPQFKDAPGRDYRLKATSPLIDAGRNAYAEGSLDLDSATRIVPDDGIVDLGAYEALPPRGSVILLQ